MLHDSNEACIVLDALDECKMKLGSLKNDDVLVWIEKIVISEPRSGHLLTTSREKQDIQSALLQWIPL